MLLGVISDTHNLLRDEAVLALRGSDRIIHAGDICRESLLDELELIAPVTAVRGNNDHGDWADKLPLSLTTEFGGINVHVVHILADTMADFSAESIKVVISGHSHRPGIHLKGGVHYLNPGSAGRTRFRLPATVAKIRVEGTLIDFEIIMLAAH